MLGWYFGMVWARSTCTLVPWSMCAQRIAAAATRVIFWHYSLIKCLMSVLHPKNLRIGTVCTQLQLLKLSQWSQHHIFDASQLGHLSSYELLRRCIRQILDHIHAWWSLGSWEHALVLLQGPPTQPGFHCVIWLNNRPALHIICLALTHFKPSTPMCMSYHEAPIQWLHFHPSEPDAPQASYGPNLVLGCFCTWANRAVFGSMPSRWPFSLIIFSGDVLLVFHDDPSQKLGKMAASWVIWWGSRSHFWVYFEPKPDWVPHLKNGWKLHVVVA